MFHCFVKMTDNNSSEKRLKSVPPDLTVLVGEAEKPFEYYSMMMASYSRYIDNMLSSGMKESTTMTIRFPDIEESTWLEMIAPLQDPLKTKAFSVTDALKLVRLYDKYEFEAGRSLCTDTFDKFLNRSFSISERLTFIEISRCTDDLGMKALYDRCIGKMAQELKDRYCWMEFSLEYLKAMAPFVEKEESLLSHSFTDKEGVTSPLWPEVFWLRKCRECGRPYDDYPEWFKCP